MPLDLSNLTPAPWFNWSHGETGDFGLFHGAPADPREIFDLLDHQEPADLEFIAIARNAFDVMMRRGWYPIRVQGQWHVFSKGSPEAGMGFGEPADDPFTALVEADAWMKQQESPTQAE